MARMTSDHSTPKPRVKLAVRVVCYLLATVIVVLLGLAGALIVVALGPDPGYRIYLMGLPMLALPMVICCLLLLGVVSGAGHHLRRVERWGFFALGGSFTLVFGALYALG